jgi:pimeloyl-ACP methyl ester carboxylesterase
MTVFPPATPITLAPRTTRDGARVGEITLSVHEAGSGPAVVLCHGFPELAYSWRHQLTALAEAGFRAIAPDQRGYGASDRPEAIADYDIHHLCGDMTGLLDALGIEKAVFCGHDWGGFVVWAMPILHPERTAGVIGVNTPYFPRAAEPPTAAMRKLAGGQDEKMYILWFQEAGVADPMLAASTRAVFEMLMRGGVEPLAAVAAFSGQEAADKKRDGQGGFELNPFLRIREIDPPGEPIMPDEELEFFITTFEKTGFTGGVNWYRNFDRNWETAPEVGTEKIEVPSLMVTAEWDPVLRPEMAAGMSSLVTDLETAMIERCGHWTQQEKPDELNRILVDWLGRRFL